MKSVFVEIVCLHAAWTMTASLDTFVFIIVVSLLVIRMMTVVPVNHAVIIHVKILAQKIHVGQMLYVLFQIIEQHALVWLVWYLARRQQLVAFVRLHYLVPKIVDVLQVMAALMNCVDLCVPVIRTVLAMNDANEDLASHYVVEMMTAGMVKFAKVLFVRLAVDRMIIVLIICRVSISNVLILVSEVHHVERMLNVNVLIIKSNVHAHHPLLVTPTLAANIRQLFVDNTMIVHQIILATEMYVKPLVVVTKIAYPMKDVFVEFVELFVIVMLLVDKDKFVKIVCVKLDAEATLFAPVIKHVSTTNVRILVQRLDNVAHALNALLLTTAFNAVALLASLEML